MAIKISGTTVIDDSRNFTNIQEINGLDYPASDGSAGQVLTTDGAGSLSLQDLPPAGPTVEAIASGTLPDGSPVVVNSDGTVSVVEGVVQEAGSPTVFENAFIRYPSATFDSNENKVVIAYRDEGNNDYGTAVVGTVSGNSISFGSPTVYLSEATRFQATTFDSNENKVVIAYQDGSGGQYGEAVVGTVSGTSISFSSPTFFHVTAVNTISATFDSNENKVVIAYRDKDHPDDYGRAVVGTVSGTSIDFGSKAFFAETRPAYISATFDSNENKVVIAYQDFDNDDYGNAVVGTVSGTSISFGTPTVFNSAKSNWISATFDSNENKVVIAYQDKDNSNVGTAIVGTVSGTSISFGSPIVFSSIFSNGATIFDPSQNKVVITYNDFDGSSDLGSAIVGTVSGNSISFGSSTGFVADPKDISTTFDSNENKVVIAYRDQDNSYIGTSVVFQPGSTNLTSENFIGFSNAAYSDTQTATIQALGSVNDSQTGLNTARSYFVQTDGTLAETPGEPEVFAGTAMSSNKIIVKG